MTRNDLHQQSGYIALMTVIIISAVALALATTVALLALGEAESSFALSQGEGTLQFVDGCMEDALQNIWNNASYTGGNITRPEGTCVITVSQAGSTYTVTATNSSTQYQRTEQAVVNRGTTLTIQSWKEL